MPNTVRVGVGVTGARQASSDLDRFRDKFTQLQKQGAKGLAIGAGVAATQQAFSLLDRALASSVHFAGEAAQAFIDDQRSVQQLGTSLRANVVGWNGNTDAIERVIKANAALGFADDEQRQSLAKLVAATHDVNKALEVERVAMDLARFKGISLSDASDALTKVEAGSYRVLKSLGIQLADNATQTDALAAVEKVASGQAADFANTIEGKLTVAQVKAHEAEEKLGKGFAELEAMILPAVADAFSNAADSVDQTDRAFQHFASLGIKPTKDEFVAYRRELGVTDVSHERLISRFRDLSDAALNVARSEGAETRATHDFGDAAKEAWRPVHDLASVLSDADASATAADDSISGLASTIDQELFGKAITAGHLADLRQTHDELVKQRDAVEKGSRKWKILTGDIADNEQAQFDLQLQQKQKEGPQAVLDWLKTQIKRFGDATGAIQKLIDEYIELAYWQNYDFGKQEHFGGGPQGGGGGGGGSSGGGGGHHPPRRPESTSSSHTTIINVSTPALTPGSAQELARHLEPIITRAQQRRGIVGAARAF